MHLRSAKNGLVGVGEKEARVDHSFRVISMFRQGGRLSIGDEYTRECFALKVDRSMPDRGAAAWRNRSRPVFTGTA
jgi:hypothetical protein